MCAVALKRSPGAAAARPPRRQARPLSRLHRGLRPDIRQRAPRWDLLAREIKIDGYLAQLVGLSYGMSVLTSSSKLAERLIEGTPKKSSSDMGAAGQTR